MNIDKRSAAGTPPRDQTASTDQQHVSGLVNGFWAAQVLSVAAMLRIPDRLAEEGMSAAALAAAAQAHAPSVLRLMRALQTLGICRAHEDGTFELTPAGHFLRSDVPGSMRGRALFTGDMLWRQFGDLAHVVRTGGPARTVKSGPEGFAELRSDPARLDAFQQAMAEGSVRAARAAIGAYDFSRFRRVLDLGGGYGGVLSVLLQTYPQMEGAVCDLEYLANPAIAYLQRAGVAERSEFLPGDFFESVPAGFDAYVMKFIIHDWDDEHAATILANCRKAAGPQSRVILLEQVVPERLSTGVADQAVIRADLTMMTVGGKERTATEYGTLLAGAGWRMTQVVRVSAEFSLVEAQVA